MGKVFKAIGKIISSPFKILKNIVDPPEAKVVQQTAEPTAQAAPTAAPTANQQETGVDTTGMTLKRKAKGKRALMISPANTGSGTNGTGLNL
jgi:hypothetical protein